MLVIKEMTEEDLKKLARAAERQWKETVRPNKTGPRWDRVVTYDYPIRRDVSLGNMTQFKIAAFYTDFVGRLFVGIEGKGAYTFEAGVHWVYAQEKLGLLEGDARNVADWINAQLQVDFPEQGVYEYDSLFAEEDRPPESATFNGA